MSQVRVEDVAIKKSQTLADVLRPLLITMKLFGMYFRRRTDEHDKSTCNKSRRVQWNGYLIYSASMVAHVWLTLLRMLSVFTKEDALFRSFLNITTLLLLCDKFILNT